MADRTEPNPLDSRIELLEASAARDEDAILEDERRRREVVARMAAFFGVLSVLTALSIIPISGAPRGASVAEALGAVGYALAWCASRRPAMRGGGELLVAALLVQHVTVLYAVVPTPAWSIGYFTGVVPLIAAAALPSSRLVWAGIASLGAFAAEALISHAFGEGDTVTHFAPSLMFLCLMWVVATVIARSADDSLRSRAEEQRRRREEAERADAALSRYRIVADHVDDLVSVLDAEGRFLYASPSHDRVLGIERSTLVGSPLRTLPLAPTDAERLGSLFSQAIDEGPADAEVPIARGDSAPVWFHIRMARADDPVFGRCVVLSARDVTEARRLTDALESTRRMESLGRLAGGVAHDFNNLLHVIRMCAELIERKLPAEHVALRDVRTMESAAERAAALTSQLLTFARRQVVPRGRTRVASAVQELKPILERICGPEVLLEVTTVGSTIDVDASPVQVEQIVLNLVSNACDAMSKKGRVSVRVVDRALDDREVPPLPAGTFATIEVADDGPGMSAEVKSRVFEPFFTTKAQGQGTGLGLATVIGIAGQLGGTAEVKSSPGEGATFRVYLPRASAPTATEQVSTPVTAIPASPTSLRVLLVDDDDPVRESVARMLVDLGHRVVEARDGSAALQHAKTEGVRVDVLVTDVSLGSDSTLSYVDELLATQASCALLLISGFSPSLERIAQLTDAGGVFLAKPFTGSALRGALLVACEGRVKR